MIEFVPLPNATPSAGLVLRLGKTESRYLRLTHVFEDCVYVMWVSEPEQVRYARRPVRKLMQELKQLTADDSAAWGRIVLPTALTNRPLDGSERALALDSAWSLISPLVKSLEHESNLTRSMFTASIRERAAASQTSFITLQRLVLRYYYFGGTRLALLPLPRGVKPGAASRVAVEGQRDRKPPKRRGRQPGLAEELGANEFIVGEDDIEDMINSLKASLRKGPTNKSTAHEDYLAGAFRRRHPDIHTEYIAGKRVEPVTVRQFRYYIDSRARLSEDLAKNLRTYERNPGYMGSVYAAGPGEVYEIDATGGRLYLVSPDDPPVLLGQPTIYLFIDRWSRFVVSAYMSLRPPSYEEVRLALLIAFTSREKRFRGLRVDIDDERWPIGRVPAVICSDRGSEFIGKSMEQAVVDDLRIELTPLPPLCPDGKAIVERLIREIKRRMAASKLKGTYADRPSDPHTKHAARTAKVAAVHTLAEAYRNLIEIITDHNNRPHSSLRRRRILTQAGIEPTPRNAYLWGLKHIAGLRSPPLTEADYRRLLLSIDTASISNGVLRYKSRPYLPENEAAFDLAAKSTARARQINIRLDRTHPDEIEVPTVRGDWALFRITDGAANELAGLTLDEEETLASQNARLWARAEHQARIERVAAKSPKATTPKKHGERATTIDKQRQLAIREQETASLKAKLTGQSPPSLPDESPAQTSQEEDWQEIEEQERLQNLERIRQHRSKR